jgi:hypothetical protein
VKAIVEMESAYFVNIIPLLIHGVTDDTKYNAIVDDQLNQAKSKDI